MKMTYVNLPDAPYRRLPFYLATEEYLARDYKFEGDLFFMWQVAPTVIFGRNQIIEDEVDIDYCLNHGIEMYRRKSGGGCVFANPDNIMFSYITPSTDCVTETFLRYTTTICRMLRSLGIDAQPSDRNDILIHGKKVSGTAFYHLPERDIVHGTMLFDTNREQMHRAITPSKTKLESKGIKSVKNRVTTIHEHLDIGIEQFKDYARQWLANGREITLTSSDVKAIEQLEQPYHDPKWMFGSRHAAKTVKAGQSRRIEGVGEINVSVITDLSNCITGLQLAGDYFQIADGEDLLTKRLTGVKYDPDEIKNALEGFSANNVAVGLTDRQLIELFFDN